MFCAQQQLKNLLKKCEAKGVKVNQLKCVREFLKEHDDDYCKPKKRIYFKVILIISLLIYAVTYYYGHLRTEVSKAVENFLINLKVVQNYSIVRY